MVKKVLRLKPSTYCVFLYVEKQCELTGSTDMTIQEFLQNMPFKISVITLHNALKELQQLGIISKKRSLTNSVKLIYSMNRNSVPRLKRFKNA